MTELNFLMELSILSFEDNTQKKYLRINIEHSSFIEVYRKKLLYCKVNI